MCRCVRPDGDRRRRRDASDDRSRASPPPPFGSSIGALLLIAFCVLQHGYALPVRLRRQLIEDNVQNYLMKFGYLSPSPREAGALRTEESVRKAIRELQEFASIPVTGNIDERTKKLLATPRCGLSDIEPHDFRKRRRKRFMLHGQKWGYANLTWSLRTTDLKELNVYEVRYVFTKALDVWAKHSKLTFTEVDSDRADILIYFHRGEHGDNFAFDGPGQILAHAFFPGSGRGGDAHFDRDENWSTREDDDEGTSLFHVAAHEFGHSLGLSHSSEEGALMYPWYQGMQNGFDYELPDDDRLGIQSLYGTYQEKLWGQNPAYRPVVTSRPNAPTRYTPPIVTFTTPKYRPPDAPRRPPYPDYPRYPRPNPNYPKKYPENNTPNPEKPYYPRKPMHPDKKNTPKYPNYNPYYPERPYPTKFPKLPDRRYPNKYPQFPESTTVFYTNDRRFDNRRPPYPPKEENIPDTCNTSYDAISVIRREVFIFKDKYFWRIGDDGLQKGYPAETKRFWKGLPRNFTHIDAAYEKPNNKLVFFIGKQYYQYTGNNLDPGYPRPLTDLGLPPSLERIDAAMVWGHNGKTYLFSGNMYWRFDEDVLKVELDYPRDMSMWRGVGTNIDAVFQWKDGKTYFFKGNGFWKFNDLRMRVEKEQKMLSAPFWMGCSRNLEGAIPGRKAPYTVTLPTSNSSNLLNYSVSMLVLSMILQLYKKII